MIGAPKAGTTTLAADLAAHSSLWLPPAKELGWFDVRWRDEPLAAYHADFAAAPVTARIGEATPTYLHVPGALERIAELVPDVRLVVLLRDPVARAWSHYWYNRTARLVEDVAPEEALRRNESEYLDPGRYAAHLHRARTLFDPAQLHVALLDDLMADPVAVFAAVCRHLGVDEVPLADPGRRRNSAYRVRSPWARRQMLRFRLWKRLPFGLGYRLDEWNRAPLRTPEMPGALRAELSERYADDTAELASLLGRPVPWAAADQGAP